MPALLLGDLGTFLRRFRWKTLKAGENLKSVGDKTRMRLDHVLPAGCFHDLQGVTTHLKHSRQVYKDYVYEQDILMRQITGNQVTSVLLSLEMWVNESATVDFLRCDFYMVLCGRKWRSFWNFKSKCITTFKPRLRESLTGRDKKLYLTNLQSLCCAATAVCRSKRKRPRGRA